MLSFLTAAMLIFPPIVPPPPVAPNNPSPQMYGSVTPDLITGHVDDIIGEHLSVTDFDTWAVGYQNPTYVQYASNLHYMRPTTLTSGTPIALTWNGWTNGTRTGVQTIRLALPPGVDEQTICFDEYLDYDTADQQAFPMNLLQDPSLSDNTHSVQVIVSR